MAAANSENLLQSVYLFFWTSLSRYYTQQAATEKAYSYADHLHSRVFAPRCG